MTRYDIIIVGGGAGGLVAAREARRRGAAPLIVQSGPIGGDCTHTGCVPSKALLAAAARGDGFDGAMRHVHDAVGTIAATEDAAALASDGIAVIEGFARFRSPTTIDVDGTAMTADKFIVATGATPLLPPITGLREARPLTNETVFSLNRLPTSLAILGGGPIGCEMAEAFARLGSNVILVEAAERILPREEPEASATVHRALQRFGVTVRVGAPVVAVARRADGSVQLDIERGEAVEADDLLAAIGRAPAGRGFGLEEIGVNIDQRGAIVVDDSMATNVSGIWAAGDVTGRLQFTHVAGRMGWIAASNALGRLGRVRPFKLATAATPWATFTTPEVARVGLSVAEAAERHPRARVAHLPLGHVDRAVAVGATDGFVTLIAAPRRGIGHLGGGRLIGATVVAPTAGELIHEAALAIQTKMFAGRLAQTTHAYPTWSMAMQQAALQFFGTSAGLTARPISAVANAARH